MNIKKINSKIGKLRYLIKRNNKTKLKLQDKLGLAIINNHIKKIKLYSNLINQLDIRNIELRKGVKIWLKEREALDKEVQDKWFGRNFKPKVILRKKECSESLEQTEYNKESEG